MVLHVGIVVLFLACIVVVVVFTVLFNKTKTSSPTSPASPASPASSSQTSQTSPAASSQTSQASSSSARAGSKLPTSCKITGDVFGANARVNNGVRRENVRATYHYYAPQYATSTLACADIIHKWPQYSAKVLMYPWTASCIEGSQNWNPQRMCGKCLRVKNRGTGASIIVRVVDSGGCSGPSKNGLDLDPCAFNAIDTDKKGILDGHMMVDVEEVEC